MSELQTETGKRMLAEIDDSIMRGGGLHVGKLDIAKCEAEAIAIGARDERERLRHEFIHYHEWLVTQRVYGNGGGWGEAAMSKVYSLLAEPEAES